MRAVKCQLARASARALKAFNFLAVELSARVRAMDGSGKPAARNERGLGTDSPTRGPARGAPKCEIANGCFFIFAP